MVLEIKKNFKQSIDTLLSCKRQIFKESLNIDQCVERMRCQLSSEQTAKFLILMEKFKAKEEFSVFNLWNIKKKEEVPEKPEAAENTVSVTDLQVAEEDADLQAAEEDADMDLPNDEDDMHKII